MIPAEGHGALPAAPLNGIYARVAAMNICGPQVATRGQLAEVSVFPSAAQTPSQEAQFVATIAEATSSS